MTPFQLEASAKAPCTSTIVGLASVRWDGSAVAVTRNLPSRWSVGTAAAVLGWVSGVFGRRFGVLG
jgi:hypothetical protein